MRASSEGGWGGWSSLGPVCSRRRAASPAPSYARSAAPAPALQLAKGDQVRHRAFGLGMVLSAQKVGGDVLLEIAFDQVGTKRLMLKSAASHMEKV